jgi:hypothetical protein
MAFTMALHADGDGTLHAELSPATEGQCFRVKPSILIVRLWHESINVVRGSLHHPASGATAYIQGTDELAGISRALDLEVTRPDNRSFG